MLERLTAANSQSGDLFALLMIDIDHFKRINDSFGHAVGDAVLCVLGDTLRAAMGEQDFSSRWGGEEFLLLIASNDIAVVRIFCEHLRVSAEALRIEHNGRHIGCTISVGFAMHQTAIPLENTIREVDRALYAAKSYGRNTVVFAGGI
jgi:diguanylate cyclase (GGDEF)-like protein